MTSKAGETPLSPVHFISSINIPSFSRPETPDDPGNNMETRLTYSGAYKSMEKDISAILRVLKCYLKRNSLYPALKSTIK